MAKQFRIPMKNLVDAKIEAKEGKKVKLDLGGKVMNVVITKVEKDFVIVTVKE